MEETKSDYKEELDQTREKIIEFIKKRYNWLIYIGLVVVLWFGAFIRTRNIPLLKDVTTGGYTLPDLDPYLFLRHARYILEHGGLPVIDYMRFVPVGRVISSRESIIPYIIVYIHKFIKPFFPQTTIELTHILYPVIFFVIGGLVFFFLIKRLFNAKVALLSTAFLTILPSFLYRTMGGVGDKEPLGIFLMFLSMYLYIVAWQSNNIKKSILFSVLSGLSTGLMGLVWGGFAFLLIIIALSNFMLLLLDKFEKKDFYIYLSWILPVVLIIVFLRDLDSIPNPKHLVYFARSFPQGLTVFVLIFALIDLLLFKLDIIKIKNKISNRIPPSIMGVAVSFVISFITAVVLFTPSFVSNKIEEITNGLLRPLGNNRWLVTVAENHRPYLLDLLNDFGRFYIYLFVFGSILLFYNMVKPIKKHKIKLTALYSIFIFSFMWSRYSSGSIWNGASKISLMVYIGSMVVLTLIFGIMYIYAFYKNKEIFDQIKLLDRRYIFVFAWMLLMIIAALGAIRLFFVFAPITTVLVSYLFIETMRYSLNIKTKLIKVLSILIILLILFSPISLSSYTGLVTKFAKNSYNQAKYTGLSYNQQWQEAMSWVRQNTPKDAVFGHWWDYGYWVQTGGERATILDGANTKLYWDYLMGRHVLTGQNETEALEFLKIHKATHFLIDPSDIGKYPAYSSIGSDQNWDRYSWIGTYVLNPSRTTEDRNQTLLLYQGGTSLDADFIYNNQIFPAQNAGIAGFIIPVNMVGNDATQITDQPQAVLIYNNQQTNIPLECIYINNQIIKFNQPGLKGCLRFIPTIDSNGQGNLNGAALYISEKGTRAMWVRLYLLNEKFENFKEVYSDNDKMPLALFSGRQIGPMRIWELSYPENIKEKQEYFTGDLPEWF